eukprot:NODE_2129_length_2286_cov_14.777675.p1 GENE.NODE_2129_length_2286_cov_14.777675~~NODE_2129_length_2286_cov_14.777675.p1  ORF type:complete len:661 (-),score=96.04 NODE_2129_length_2286_cov_14.777675:208-2190(-)
MSGECIFLDDRGDGSADMMLEGKSRPTFGESPRVGRQRSLRHSQKATGVGAEECRPRGVPSCREELLAVLELASVQETTARAIQQTLSKLLADPMAWCDDEDHAPAPFTSDKKAWVYASSPSNGQAPCTADDHQAPSPPTSPPCVRSVATPTNALKDNFEEDYRIMNVLLAKRRGPEPRRLHRVSRNRGTSKLPVLWRLRGAQPLARCHQTARKVAQHSYFERVCTLMILISSVIIGIDLDDKMRNFPVGSSMEWMMVTGYIFTTWFTIEIVIRLTAECAYFFSTSNPDLGWNIFDSIVVLSSLMEELGNVGVSIDLKFLRAMRLLRLVRIFRAVRIVRFFSELRVIVQGLVGSSRSLLWCLVLLGLVMYMGATILVALLITEGEAAQVQLPDAMAEHFGSLGPALFTLHSSMLGGSDWADIAKALFDFTDSAGTAYLLYMTFAVLCLMNLITGIFVEKATAIIWLDLEHNSSEEETKRAKWLGEMRVVFGAGEGKKAEPDMRVSSEMFLERVLDSRMQAFLERVGLVVDERNARSFYNVMDEDGSDSVRIDDLFSGLETLSGSARQIDMYHMSRLMLHVQSEMQTLRKEVGDRANIAGTSCGKPLPRKMIAPEPRQAVQTVPELFFPETPPFAWPCDLALPGEVPRPPLLPLMHRTGPL